MSVNSLLLFLQVFLKQGPYGYYVQVGEDKKGMCPKRAALSADVIIALIFK
jgi:topoisomerase IA-like protein